MLIIGEPFKGLRRKRPTRRIDGHEAFTDFMEGPGAAAALGQQLRERRAAIAADPKRGYSDDKSLRLVACVPAEVYMYWESRNPGCWNDDSFVRQILDEMPDCLMNPDTRTAKGLKRQRAR